MNLIACDQYCKHQQEGYCTLNHISSLTGSTESKCGYFEKTDSSNINNIPLNYESMH